MRLLLGRAAWLVAVWLLLWEDLSIGSVLGGSVVAGAVLAAFPPRAAQREGRIRLSPAVKFLGYFAFKLVQSSLVVAWEIVTPQNRINEAIVAVPVRHSSDALTTLVANAISLTPGTLTVDVDRNASVLYVHVLHFRSVEEVRREVGTLETMAVRAFGSSEAISRIANPGSPAAGPQ